MYCKMVRRGVLFLCCLTMASVIRAQTPGELQEKKPSVSVELIETGKAPHRKLRYSTNVGDKASKVMTTKMNQKIEFAGKQAPAVSVPAQKVYMNVETTNVKPSGDFEFAYEYTDMVIEDDPANSSIVTSMREMLKPMIGLKGTATMDSRGFIKDSEMVIPDGLNPLLKNIMDGLKSSMNQMSSPVPDEAVGQGAKWNVVQNVTLNGISIKQTMITELIELDATGYRTKTSFLQEADEQEIKNPMLPMDASIKLNSLKSSGEGNSHFLHKGIMPEKSMVRLNSKASMDMTIAGQKQEMTTVTDMEMSIENSDRK